MGKDEIEFLSLSRSPSDPSKIEANATGASEMCETRLWKFMEMNVRFFRTLTLMIVRWAEERDFPRALLPAQVTKHYNHPSAFNQSVVHQEEYM